MENFLSQLPKLQQYTRSTGFITFVEGEGYNDQGDEKINCFMYGLQQFFDPLCAYELSKLLKNKEHKTACQIVCFSLLELTYGLKCPFIIKSVEPVNCLCSDGQLNQIWNLILHICQFKIQNSQNNYDQIIETFAKLKDKSLAAPIILRLLCSQTQNNEKRPKEVFSLCEQCNFGQYINQCQQNLKLMPYPNCFTELMCSVLLEIVFFGPLPPELITDLYESKYTNDIKSQILIIRQYGKLARSTKVLEQELTLNSHSPIIYYSCGKYDQDGGKAYFQECRSILNDLSNKDLYTQFVYEFYSCKLEILYPQTKTNYKIRFIDTALYQNCKQLYDNNLKLFEKVRTLQFYSIRQRIDKQLFKIEEFNNNQSSILNERREQINTMYSMRMSIKPIQKSIIGSPIGPKWNSHIGGNQYYDEGLSSRQNYFVSKYHQLNFVNLDEISNMKFICKCNRDGELYQGSHNDIQLTIKAINYMRQLEIDQYFANYKQLAHPNLRKIYGYALQDLPDDCAVLYILYQKCDTTLRLYMKQEHSIDELWKLGCQVVDALYYLHQQGYKHCNLHTNNILIYQGMAILVDFDFEFDEEYQNKYYSPGPGLQDDIYSLGCVLLFIFFRIEFQFEIVYTNTVLSIEEFGKINPWNSKFVDFEVKGQLENYGKQIIMACLRQKISLEDILKQFYDNL